MDDLFQKLETWLWHPKVETLPAPLRWLVEVFRFLYAVIRDVVTTDLTLRAMGLVYITILSIVPMLALTFSALKGFGIHRSRIKPALLNIFEPLGEQGVEITEELIGFVDNIQGGLLAGAGLMLLIYTTVSMIKKIEDSLNRIWRVDNARSFVQRFGEYLSLILVGPLVMVSVLGLIGGLSSNALVDWAMEFKILNDTSILLGKLSPYLLVSLLFSLMYWFIPNTRVKFSAALTGGVTGGVLWAFSGVLFATFVVGSTRNFTIYSSFAIVIIALMWLYISWLILLTGAQVSFYYQNREYLRVGYRQLHIGNKLREQAALSIMTYVADAFRNSAKSQTTNDIGNLLGLPGMLLSPIKTRLINAKLLKEDRRGGLMPSRDPATISVAEVLAAVREPQDEDVFRISRWPKCVDNVFAEIDTQIGTPLYSKNIYGLLDETSDNKG